MEQILQHLMQEKLNKGQLQLKSLWYISGGYISETYDYTIESGILSYLILSMAQKQPIMSLLLAVAIDYKICIEK